MQQQKAGCLFGWLPKLFSPEQKPKALELPRVMVSKKFISVEENAFFHILRQIVGTRAHILAQVALNRLLFFPGNAGRGGWKNKIDKRSIDFVLCDPRTLSPLIAIELDDATHQAANRRVRDEEVGAIMQAAGLPLLRFRCRPHYDANAIAAQLLPLLPK